MRLGPYLRLALPMRGGWRMASEDSGDGGVQRVALGGAGIPLHHHQPFLLIVRTGRIVTTIR